MKIAIIGGTGLLGRYLIRCINEQRAHTPIIISRSSFNVQSDVIIRTTDYSIGDLIEKFEGMDAVVHLAAQRGSSKSIRDFEESIYITQNIYEACIKTKIPNIVYASSIAVYSGDVPLPWSEYNCPSPQTIYGISKITCEYLGNFYMREYGLDIKNLRFPPIFGLVDKCDKMKERMINKFMIQALEKEKITLFSNNSGSREFLYAKDAVQAIIKAIEAKTVRGTFNISSGETLTNQEIAETINTVFENEGNIVICERDSQVSESSFMTGDKAYNTIGFKPQYSFYNAIKDIYKEIKNV